ncbi:MAG: PHP domain-containing protein [Candidatus Sumerlaeia bacterium]|nr:PHP domain-containing protein [Candidatus Sumerlaeia bacterium]
MSANGAGERPFVHLHTHSHFSLADGVAAPDALVRQAAALDIPALALTDHNTLAGLIPFLEACESAGLQPIVGCQLDVLPGAGPWQASAKDLGSLVLLVESEIGYRNLSHLVTVAQSKTLNRWPPHVTQSELAEHCAGLIALIGPSSPIRHFINPPDVAKVEEFLTELVRAFGKENLFFELQPAVTEDEHTLNDYFIQIGQFLGIGMVAANDVHYLWPEDELAWQFLTGRRPPQVLGEKAAELGPRRRHLADGREMRHRFAFIPHVIDNTAVIAERCRYRPPLRQRRLLVHDFARGFDAESYLWDLVFHFATEKYGTLSEEVKSRLNEEFDYVSRCGLANYLQLLWQVAKFLREQQIPCLVRRGPITTSLIAYVIGLTGVNPLAPAHRLSFEPLIEEGAVFPDVTIQVPARYLPRLCEYLRRSYGVNRVARLGRYQYWPKPLLMLALSQWAGLPRQRAEMMMQSGAFAARADKSLRWADLFAGNARPLSSHHAAVLNLVFQRLHPLPRTLVGQDNRLVLAGEPLSQIAPLAYPEARIPAAVHPAHSEADLRATTQMDAADCDALGLPRITLMSSRPLSILDDAMTLARRDAGRSFDLRQETDNDPETFHLLGTGRTAGIPGFEGIGVRALLQREKPASLDRLIHVMNLSIGSQETSRRTPPGTVIADCWLAYRCAFLKAHYPVQFYTALLTRICRNRKWLARVLREMDVVGIRLLPPDINLSSYAFTSVNERIRAGLIVVQQMGEKAADEIHSVRHGGAFNNLLDFCRRTDPKLVPQRLIENLIKAGAMDSFNLHRSQMLAMLDKAVEQPRAPAGRSSPLVQMQFDFAGADSAVAIPAMDELPLSLRLQYEMQAAGYTFSGDLLAPFADLLKRCRVERGRIVLSSRMEGRDLYLAGLVSQIEKATLPTPNEPAWWLDFEGVMAAVPDALFEARLADIRSGEPLMLGGKVTGHQGIYFLRVHTIVPLFRVHQQATQARQLVLDLEHENKQTLRLLCHVCGQYPGSTAVVVSRYHGSGRFTLRRLQARKVTVCPGLINDLRRILDPERISVVGFGDTLSDSEPAGGA